MSDTPTPADVLTTWVRTTWDVYSTATDEDTAHSILAALAAAGFVVVQVPDGLPELLDAVTAHGNGLLAEIDRHLYGLEHGVTETTRLAATTARVKRLAALLGGEET